MPTFILGYNAKLYRNTGTYGSPVWDEIPNVKDLKLNVEKEEADGTTRASGGWKTNVQTLKDASVDFDMLWDPSDTDFTAIRTSFFADTTIEFLALDGPVATTGSQGLRATCQVQKFSRDEKINEPLKVDVTIKPSPAANAPSWFVAP